MSRCWVQMRPQEIQGMPGVAHLEELQFGVEETVGLPSPLSARGVEDKGSRSMKQGSDSEC